MTEQEIRAKISHIRSQVEDLQAEARELWEKDSPESDDALQLMYDLEDVATALGELEGDVE